ncbi:hypothetical protein SYNPS1DRAFT_21900 [Syncephalis pseudoplumigaleata]|uniref:Uncharacterized protein n=1 Tax=Syncephalis pseudoplumigaleata TaxID=1712513 RepID=A0A4P9Z1V1_9FUNG|nr:hypothetical protein SYNPS1DRAFT_21900 [Syncephalis pseudoplumigaleata]|eukprot:RKP26318.1 hypothetical protein SYNPS1DRAFT_21900 [Syncephalis pseudoplumigaleata]
MSLLVDCHAHLYPPYCTLDELASGFGASMARMPACIAVTETCDDIRAIEAWLALPSMAPLAARTALCIGLHPMQRSADVSAGSTTLRIASWLASRAELEAYAARSPRVVGIGEIGLDFSPHVLATHPDGAEAAREEQRVVFKAQLELARRLHLPVNIHSRQAGRHVLDVLREVGYGADAGDGQQAPGILLHAFDGRPKYVREGLALGAYYSIAPSLARDPLLERLVQQVPLDRLVLESDTPALGMKRGKPSTPGQIEWVCGRIAELKGVPPAEVATTTTDNAYRLFPRLKTLMTQ